MIRRLAFSITIGAMLFCPAVATAQSSTTALTGLGAPARAEVERVIDSARVAGLPVDPLYDKVAEGQLKEARDADIVTAVRSLAKRFVDVRAALGPGLDAGAMSAAATALRGGLPMARIQQLAKASAGSAHANTDLTVALITVADLLQQRVPMEPAVTSIESLLKRRAPDDQFARLRLGVQADIVGGKTPEAAMRGRFDLIIKSIRP